MTYGQGYALAARNAQACEEARQPDCSCACGGRFHGAAHPGPFVAEYAAQLAAVTPETPQIDLLEAG